MKPLPLCRDNDFFLMELVATRQFVNALLDAFNCIGIHLQALTSADIATGDGTRIRPKALAGF